MRELPLGKVTKVHPYAAFWEPLEGDPGFVLRSMFGGRGVYIDGKQVLLFYARSEPDWRGIYVCTAQEHHASLRAELPSLAPHTFLAKWLFVPETHDRFESTAEKLVALVKRRDPRVGVLGKPRKRKSKTRRAKKL